MSHVCGFSALSVLGGGNWICPDSRGTCKHSRTHAKSNCLGFCSRRWTVYELMQHKCETWWNVVSLFSFCSAFKSISSSEESTFQLGPARNLVREGFFWRSNDEQMQDHSSVPGYAALNTVLLKQRFSCRLGQVWVPAGQLRVSINRTSCRCQQVCGISHNCEAGQRTRCSHLISHRCGNAKRFQLAELQQREELCVKREWAETKFGPVVWD